MEAPRFSAAEEEQLRHQDALPEPPPGVRVGSPAYRLYREEAYQAMHLQINSLRHQLREYNEIKRRQFEPILQDFENARKDYVNAKKEAASAATPPQSRSGTAWRLCLAHRRNNAQRAIWQDRPKGSSPVLF